MTSSSSVQVEPDLNETSLSNSTKNPDNNLGGGVEIGITNPAFEDDFRNLRNNSLEENRKISSDYDNPDITMNYQYQSDPSDEDLRNEIERVQIGHKIEPLIISSSTSENKENKPKIWKKFIGILFTLLSSLCFSFILVVTKLLPHLHPITQTVWRQLVNVCISGMIMAGLKLIPITRDQAIWKGIVDCIHQGKESSSSSSGVNIHCTVIGKIMTVGVLTSTGMLCRVTALNYLTIADATVMTYLSLVFVLALSHFILHEKCLIVQSLMAGLIILGAFIIARPPFLTGEAVFETSTLIGVGIKIIDSLTAALFVIGMRYLRTLHFAPMILIINITGFFVALSASFALNLFKLPENLSEMLLFSGLGCLTAMSHISLLLALKLERASTVSLIRCADVPFAFMSQMFIFNLIPGTWTWIGTLFVCIGVIITSLTKLIGELSNESAIKKRLWFLLK